MEISCFTTASDTMIGSDKDGRDLYMEKLDDEKRQTKQFIHLLEKKVKNYRLNNLTPEDTNTYLNQEDLKFFEDGPNLKEVKESLLKILHANIAIREHELVQKDLASTVKEMVDYFSSD